MGSSQKYIILTFVIVAAVYTSGAKSNCGALKSDGYTVPRGDIILRHGQPLEITCNLYDNMVAKYGVNASSRLFFTRNMTAKALPRTMIDIVNSTTIRLYIENHTTVEQVNYYCLFWTGPLEKMETAVASSQSKIVCFNVVSVGLPPQNITDFSCLSRNYENLTCSWTPKNNYVKTQYNLTYHLKIRAARFHYNCSHMTITNDKMSCFWNVSTVPQYRQSHAMFYFRLRMNNTFGTNEHTFTFPHFTRVLPNPPEKLTAVAISPDTIQLYWALPHPMDTFQPGLQHRILYQCEYYPKVWQFGALITDQEKGIKTEHHYNLTGLKYAHALCDIRVSMRSKLADPDDESMWSDNATTTVRTLSKVPDGPPKTNIGSFQIVNINNFRRDVYLYWQYLTEEQKNGQNFSYYVEVDNHPEMTPVEIKKAYAKFQNLPYNDYVFHIWSVNEMGYSKDKSTIKVPAKHLSQPSDFIKVEDDTNKLYQLKWQYSRASEIINYTIFWCNNDRERPHQCNGYLDWTTVTKDTKNYSLTLPGKPVYQFAIAANSFNSSSGMAWSECTLISDNHRISKIRTVAVKHVGSDFIELRWELDCSNRNVGSIRGYIVFYCRVESSLKNDCLGPQQNATFEGDVNLQSATIWRLKPYTTYRLALSFYSDDLTYSEPSDPLYNVTNEAAPSSPQHITVYNVTNSTISLKWKAPERPNGKLKKYMIYYNTNQTTIDPDQTEITLTNLTSFRNYLIRLKACTVACSSESVPLNITTSMWVPGEIDMPVIKVVNKTHITYEWNRPMPARGKTDYYQISFADNFSSENKTIIPYQNVTSQNFTIEKCGTGKYLGPYFSVRAVNIINGEHKVGPWSKPFHMSCNDQYKSLIYLVIGFSVLMGIVIVTCGFKRAYISIKDMKNIDIKLPPGLDEKLNTSESTKSVNKIGPDEELLLDNVMKGGLRSSGESSGCSSGHASITSSLESTTHISPSDSGTEQPRSPQLSEDRKASLRQRNVPTGRPIINKGYVLPDAVPMTNWSPKSAPMAGAGYCVLGVDPSTQTETDSSCLPIDDLSTKIQIPPSCELTEPPPYVMTGDFVKMSNPGYIPHSVTDTTSKNPTGYVVAGLTKDLVAPDLLQRDTPKETSIEEKPLYVKAAESLPNLKTIQFPWQQPTLETTLPQSGYVSVGDALPNKTATEVTKAYIPHRQFEAKALKED